MTTGFFFGALAALGMICCQFAYAEERVEEKSAEAISNGLPNVSARFHPESRSYTFFADVLVWWTKELGTENWAQNFKTEGTTENIYLQPVDFDCNVGFRVGFDYGMKYDQWDTAFYYTYFRADGRHHVSTDGQITSAFLGNFYIDNQEGFAFGPDYQKASIHWNIDYNVFDWEIGRNYWVSQALALRPFIGLKGGWIDQGIHTKWKDPLVADPGSFGTAKEHMKNDFWGIGPSLGLNMKWKFGAIRNHFFSLFGDLSGAIMYGNWTFGDVYRNQVPEKVTVVLDTINSAATMLRTFLGFGWETQFSQDRYYFSLRLGYEMQVWLNQFQLITLSQGRPNNELTFQGGTFDFQFGF